ncbi:hypothetical protein ACS0TY_033396 [Phlomoides rotata]
MFLYVLAHHTKNRAMKFQFKRSGQTISKYFHGVLQFVLKLHSLFLVTPQPIPDDCTDTRWGKFKGCLGVLDGTYVDVLGSAADSRVLRDAIHRPHGLCVPRGNYYLCDNGYPNYDGFLTSYKGVRYHLNEWSNMRPQTPHEYFNMKHTRCRKMAEEDALIQCLTMIVNEGWKVDNGFKAGFHRELEKGMKRLLPGTDICATPHINSKIHVDTHVKAMRNKSWSYYDRWVDIFGKDRATTEHVVDPIDIVNDMFTNTCEQEGENGEIGDENPPATNVVDENTSIAQPSESGIKSPFNKGKKRKIMDHAMSSFIETIGEYMKGSDKTFNNIAQRLGTKYDAKIAQSTLNDVMKLIPGLSVRDKLKVSDELI